MTNEIVPLAISIFPEHIAPLVYPRLSAHVAVDVVGHCDGSIIPGSSCFIVALPLMK